MSYISYKKMNHEIVVYVNELRLYYDIIKLVTRI